MSGPGFHLSLNREDAKKIFAQPDPVAIRDYVKQLTQSKEYRKQGRLLELGDAWDALQRCLTDGTLDPTAGDPPLNHCFLGGRMLYLGDDYYVTFVRPDMTPYVAEALSEVKYDQLQKSYSQLDSAAYGRPLNDKDFQRVWVIFQQLRDFYDLAARDLSAMLFAAQR